MRKGFGALCMLIGLAMLLGAGWMLYENDATDKNAGAESANVLMALQNEIANVDAPAAQLDALDGQTMWNGAAPEQMQAAQKDAEEYLLDGDAPMQMQAAQKDSQEYLLDGAAPYLLPGSTPAVNSADGEAAADLRLLPTPTPIPEMPTERINGHDYIGYLEMPTIHISLPVMSEWSYPKLRIAPCRYWGSAYDDSLVILGHNYARHFSKIKTLQEGDPVQFIDVAGNIFQYVVVGSETLNRTAVQQMVESEHDLTLFTCTYGGNSRIAVRLDRVLAY